MDNVIIIDTVRKEKEYRDHEAMIIKNELVRLMSDLLELNEKQNAIMKTIRTKQEVLKKLQWK